jgi:hypothetical protein
MSKRLCRIAELTPSSEERLKGATVQFFTVVTTQGVCHCRRRRVRTKTLNMRHGKRKIDEDKQGVCRRMWQLAESNVVFSGG